MNKGVCRYSSGYSKNVLKLQIIVYVCAVFRGEDESVAFIKPPRDMRYKHYQPPLNWIISKEHFSSLILKVMERIEKETEMSLHT